MDPASRGVSSGTGPYVLVQVLEASILFHSQAEALCRLADGSVIPTQRRILGRFWFTAGHRQS